MQPIFKPFGLQSAERSDVRTFSFHFFLLDFLLFKTIVQVELVCLASITTTTIPIMSQICQV